MHNQDGLSNITDAVLFITIMMIIIAIISVPTIDNMEPDLSYYHGVLMETELDISRTGAGMGTVPLYQLMVCGNEEAIAWGEKILEAIMPKGYVCRWLLEWGNCSLELGDDAQSWTQIHCVETVSISDGGPLRSTLMAAPL
ncbi:MAG: hypothetical protein PWQ88_661 [Candidatus Methanomethylophilaceae archaeon]|nr:hypothetical protein [Candidatus Methanomethylophilaceae archaeon]MDI3542248.1 hypothetical protein [Candidatus Methanomethylophilaceae archaeon]HIJ00690.1 hypothetical protein [Candidatus Methanomethylophilaceae archaeon]